MSKKPTLVACTVKERAEGQKSDLDADPGSVAARKRVWFHIQLDAMPLDGRIILTEPRKDE